MQQNQQHTSIIQYLDSIAAKNLIDFPGKAKIRPATYFLPDQDAWIRPHHRRRISAFFIVVVLLLVLEL